MRRWHELEIFEMWVSFITGRDGGLTVCSEITSFAISLDSRGTGGWRVKMQWLRTK